MGVHYNDMLYCLDVQALPESKLDHMPGNIGCQLFEVSIFISCFFPSFYGFS